MVARNVQIITKQISPLVFPYKPVNNIMNSHQLFLNSSRLLTSTIRPSQFHDMVGPRTVAAKLLKKRIEDKSRSKNTNLNQASIQVLGSSCQGVSPSLLVNCEGNSYLFNCGEGFQRNCYANRVKLSNLEHLFVTRLQWPAISGAYGLSLTLQDVGLPNFTIHSTEGVADFFKSAEFFMSFTTGIDCNTSNCSNTEFSDSKFSVKCIALDDGTICHSSNHDDSMPSKRIKKAPTLIAYHCALPDLPGTLNPQRCRELRVPIGPKLALLKSGLDVTLDDGTIIRTSDVCGPKNIGPNFIVIDCPTLHDVELVVQNKDLSCLQKLRTRNGERQVDLVIHFSPNEVTEHSSYKQWMDMFASECKHILLVNQDFRRFNFIDPYRLQYLLAKVEPKLFPPLYIPEKLSQSVAAEIHENSRIAIENEIPNCDETELKFISKGDLHEQDRVIRASTFDRFNLRPFKTYETVDPKMSIDVVYRNSKLEPGYEEAYSEYKQATADPPDTEPHEPEVVFLGTGSALPSKLRNTSCILINFYVPKKASIILDCGEDSYGQIVRHYGPVGARTILKDIKMIYVSHHHADHHIGLIELLRQRKATCPDQRLQLLIPPGIDKLLNYYNESFEDLSETYNKVCTKALKLKLSSSIIENLRESMDGLLKDLTLVGVEHCANACAIVLDFNINRPGMDTFKLAYSGDARPSLDFAKIGDNCDLLIHEATFDHRETESALEKKHSTTSEAIGQAKLMRAKFTILTHFSQKYPKIPYFTPEFDETIGYAFDNMAIRCPSHFARLPKMKKLFEVIFAKSLNEIDAKHNKMEHKRNLMTKQFNNN